jgi:hypothetical protein
MFRLLLSRTSSRELDYRELKWRICANWSGRPKVAQHCIAAGGDEASWCSVVSREWATQTAEVGVSASESRS